MKSKRFMQNKPLAPTIPIQSYIHRRESVLLKLSDTHSGMAVLPNAPELIRNRDSHYPYRFDSHFYYLSGFPEPESVIVLLTQPVAKSVLFCRNKNPEREIWDGYRYGPEAAKEAFEFDESYPIELLDEKITEWATQHTHLYYPIARESTWDQKILRWLQTIQHKSRSGQTPPSSLVDLNGLLDEIRLFKDDDELAMMRHAAQITARAHHAAWSNAKPGIFEYAIEAELLYQFRKNGAQGPAYSPIVAAGKNSCVLHYIENNVVIKDGDLLLIDAGCEYEGYASDVTRTFPVNGKWTGPQHDLYSLVLSAQQAAINAVRVNKSWQAPHDAAVEVLAQGFIDLGLCKGSLNAVLETQSYKQFYMHRTGHWLGLDVHDVGAYQIKGEWRPLQPGMVLTVEPGCYVRPHDDVPAAFWNIGIRIEDDVLVTANAPEVMTDLIPKTWAALELFLAGELPAL